MACPVASLVQVCQRKLSAYGSCGIDDAGLYRATRIVELNASCNHKIRTVARKPSSELPQAKPFTFTRRARGSHRPAENIHLQLRRRAHLAFVTRDS